MTIFLVNIPSVLCFILSAIMMWGDKHWGWFFVAGILLMHTVNTTKENQ